MFALPECRSRTSTCRADFVPDADMLCGPAVVEKHLSAHEHTRGHAVVGRVLTHPGIRRTPLARWFDSKNPSSHLGALRPTRFITQNLSIPASLLSDVGGFDERFSVTASRISNWGCACPGFPSTNSAMLLRRWRTTARIWISKPSSTRSAVLGGTTWHTYAPDSPPKWRRFHWEDWFEFRERALAGTSV